MQAAALLRVRIARKVFSGHVVLENITLDIQSGEIVALLGPSGCGKSTLLRIAAGLDRHYTGEVRLSEEVIRAPNGAISLVFQEARLLPWLTVADNVAFSEGGARGARPRMFDLLDELGLRDVADTLPKALSGGMAQRAALARALYRQPAMLLLDEPFSAVDAIQRMQLQDLLLRAVRSHGVAVLLVTHDVDEAVYLADRIIVLNTTPAAQRSEVKVGIRRPRRRTDIGLAGLRAHVLDKLQEARAL